MTVHADLGRCRSLLGTLAPTLVLEAVVGPAAIMIVRPSCGAPGSAVGLIVRGRDAPWLPSGRRWSESCRRRAGGRSRSHPDVLGGGWLWLPRLRPGTSRLAFYDHCCAGGSDRGWRFESLGLPGREAAVAAELERWRELLGAAVAGPTPRRFAVGDFRTRRPSAAARQRHLGGVEQTIGLIDAGDFYQLNLCTRLHASLRRRSGGRVRGDGRQPRSRASAPSRPSHAPAAGQLQSRALSASPRTGTVTTAPIKGTAPRRPRTTLVVERRRFVPRPRTPPRTS